MFEEIRFASETVVMLYADLKEDSEEEGRKTTIGKEEETKPSVS